MTLILQPNTSAIAFYIKIKAILKNPLVSNLNLVIYIANIGDLIYS